MPSPTCTASASPGFTSTTALLDVLSLFVAVCAWRQWLETRQAIASSDHVFVTLLSRECLYSGNWRSILSVRYYVLLVLVTEVWAEPCRWHTHTHTHADICEFYWDTAGVGSAQSSSFVITNHALKNWKRKYFPEWNQNQVQVEKAEQ